jgi:hypothetical protein
MWIVKHWCKTLGYKNIEITSLKSLKCQLGQPALPWTFVVKITMIEENAQGVCNTVMAAPSRMQYLGGVLLRASSLINLASKIKLKSRAIESTLNTWLFSDNWKECIRAPIPLMSSARSSFVWWKSLGNQQIRFNMASMSGRPSWIIWQ